MSRHLFGGGAADWLLAIDGTTGDAKPGAGMVVQLFTALTGGTLVSDLLDNTGSPVTFITTDSNGFIPVFSGPDTAPSDTMKLAADANSGAGPRYWVFCTDKDAQLNSLAAQQASDEAFLTALASNTPVFNYYNTGSASYSVRPATSAPVWWVGPVPPAFGGNFAIDGLDYWIGPVA